MMEAVRKSDDLCVQERFPLTSR